MADKDESVSKKVNCDDATSSGVSVVDKMKQMELKDELRRRKLTTYGTKAVLAARLKLAMTLENEGNDDEDDKDDKDDNDDETSEDDNDDDDVQANVPEESAGAHRRMKYVPTFKDVEESMDTFSGDGETKVRRWIKEFEDTAELCEWSEVQKLIYAKRLLRGSAKLFVSYEGCGKSWKKLKKALLSEFAISVNSHEIHKRLSRRTKKSSETYQEYVYEMLAIAAQVDMEIDAVIQYVIDGIRDEEANKAILYGARNIRELKDKLRQYERMKTNQATKTKTTQPEFQKKKIPDGEEKRCFNCGDKSHVSNECPSKDKGRKCFQCNDFGHVAAKCPKKVSCNFTQPGQGKYCKNIIIADKILKALIDTGSDISLIRAEQYVRIGAPNLQDRKISIRGIGSGNITTLGQTRVTAIVDDQSFEILVHVIPDALLPYEMVLGSEFLRSVEFHQKDGNIRVSKRKDETPNVPYVCAVDVCNDANELCMSDMKSERVRSVIESVVERYTPDKTRDINVQIAKTTKAEAVADLVDNDEKLLTYGRKDAQNQINSASNSKKLVNKKFPPSRRSAQESSESETDTATESGTHEDVVGDCPDEESSHTECQSQRDDAEKEGDNQHDSEREKPCSLKTAIKDELRKERKKLEAEKRKLEEMRKVIEEEKEKLAQSKIKQKAPKIQVKPSNKLLSKLEANFDKTGKDIKPKQFPPTDVKSRKLLIEKEANSHFQEHHRSYKKQCAKRWAELKTKRDVDKQAVQKSLDKVIILKEAIKTDTICRVTKKTKRKSCSVQVTWNPTIGQVEDLTKCPEDVLDELAKWEVNFKNIKKKKKVKIVTVKTTKVQKRKLKLPAKTEKREQDAIDDGDNISTDFEDDETAEDGCKHQDGRV